MFSKQWTKIIILLFLVMLLPLIFDSFGNDIYEGAGPKSGGGGGATAKGAGGVGMKAAVAKAEEDAKKAKAALDKALADKAKAKAGTAPAAKGNEAAEETEEDSEFSELFTVNNKNDSLTYAYAYDIEPFFEGAANKKKPVCKIFSRLDKKKGDSAKLTKYIGKLTKWSDNNCK